MRELDRQNSNDVVVVGNGVIGLSLACELRAAAPELTVTVVGPAARPGAATAAAGAMLGCFGEVTATTLASPAGRARFALSRAAHGLWPGVIDDLEEYAAPGEPPLVRASGTFVIHNARSGHLDDRNLRAMVAALDECAEPYSVVDSVPGLFPTPDARPLRVLYLPGEQGLDARALLARMERRADALGVCRVDAAVTKVARGRERVTGVCLEDGEQLAAGAVAVAAGAFSSSLLDTVLEPGAIQPVLAGCGYAYTARRTSGPGFTEVVRSVNRAGSCGLHVIPLGDRVEYFGATNVVYGSPVHEPHLGVIHFLTDCVIDQLDQRASYSRVTNQFVGNRPVPLDTFPLLGPAEVGGLYLFTGTYRDGLHASPAIARLGAALVIHEANSFDPLFSPTRRPISTTTVENSIDEFVAQRISSTFESPTTLSQFMDHEELADIFRPRAERVYADLAWDEGLGSDILDHLAMNAPTPDDVLRIRRYLDIQRSGKRSVRKVATLS